jgi:hypothetical protein
LQNGSSLCLLYSIDFWIFIQWKLWDPCIVVLRQGLYSHRTAEKKLIYIHDLNGNLTRGNYFWGTQYRPSFGIHCHWNRRYCKSKAVPLPPCRRQGEKSISPIRSWLRH